MTLYHVCQSWNDGDLESLYKQHGEEAYDIFAKRWPEAGELAQYHADVIHLHSNLDDAQDFVDEFGGEILVIDTEDLNVKIDSLEYAHPVVFSVIPASNIRRFK